MNVVRECLAEKTSRLSILDRIPTLSLFELSGPLIVEEPFRHEYQGIESTDRNRETHPSGKDDDIAPTCPLFGFLFISPIEVTPQVFKLRGAEYYESAYCPTCSHEK